MRVVPSVLLLVSLGLTAVENAGAPWLPAIAALTDSRPQVHGPALEALIRHGPDVLADVGSLATDADWQVRARVVTVAAGVGGVQAVTLLVRLAGDSDERVREVTAAGLGRTPGDGVFDALHRLLYDRSLRVRQAAADGLGVLGDAQGLSALARLSDQEPVALRTRRLEALRRLTNRPDTIPALADRLIATDGFERRNLLEAAIAIADPRLVPALVQVLNTGDDVHAAHAALALAASGDGRCLEALCAMAADPRRIQPARVAADTLSKLTGVRAAAGATWALWWRENAEVVQGLTARDAFLAELHDPNRTVSREELAAFTPEMLMPLVDGLLGDGAWWWRRRAGQILLVDDPARWTPVLLQRIRISPPGEERLALIILLDQYGDPGARDGLRELYTETAKHASGRNDPERAALAIALERRGTKLDNAVPTGPRSRRP